MGLIPTSVLGRIGVPKLCWIETCMTTILHTWPGCTGEARNCYQSRLCTRLWTNDTLFIIQWWEEYALCVLPTVWSNEYFYWDATFLTLDRPFLTEILAEMCIWSLNSTCLSAIKVMEIARNEDWPHHVPLSLSDALHQIQNQPYISRDFANFTLYDPLALAFHNWLQFVNIPDEYFFQTLNLVNRTEYSQTGKVVQVSEEKIRQTLLEPRFTLWRGNGK